MSDEETGVVAKSERTSVERTYRIEGAPPLSLDRRSGLTILPDRITLYCNQNGHVTWNIHGYRVLKSGAVSDISRHEASNYVVTEPAWVPELVEAVRRAQAAIASPSTSEDKG